MSYNSHSVCVFSRQDCTARNAVLECINDELRRECRARINGRIRSSSQLDSITFNAIRDFVREVEMEADYDDK